MSRKQSLIHKSRYVYSGYIQYWDSYNFRLTPVICWKQGFWLQYNTVNNPVTVCKEKFMWHVTVTWSMCILSMTCLMVCIGQGDPAITPVYSGVRSYWLKSARFSISINIVGTPYNAVHLKNKGSDNLHNYYVQSDRVRKQNSDPQSLFPTS